MTFLHPVAAAVTAALLGVVGPLPAPPPRAACQGLDAAAVADRVRDLADELSTAARQDLRGADIGQRVRAALPAELGSTPARGGAPPGGTCEITDVGAAQSGRDAGTTAAALPRLQIAAAVSGLGGGIVATVAGLVPPLPPAGASVPAGGDGEESEDGDGSGGDQDDGSGADDDSGDQDDGSGDRDGDGPDTDGRTGSGGGAGTDGAAPSLPAPVPASPPGAPTGDAAAARLEQALRELAGALQASTDPAMRQLGGDLLGILGDVTDATPVPLPASGAPATPAPTDTSPAVPTRPGSGALPSVLPSGLTPLFSDDFEGGDLGRWGTCQAAGVNGECAGLTVADGMGVGRDPQRGSVAQFRVTDGKEAEMGGERSEVRDNNNPGTLVTEGDERWYSWSMKFPQDFPEPDGGWYILMQWHQSADSGSPPLALDISHGTLDIDGDGASAPRRTIGQIHRGQWTDYVLHVGFSPTDGFVEAWENGVQTVPRTPQPTMTDEHNYLKMGIYRDPGATGDAEVWFDDLTIHDGAGGAAPTGGTASRGTRPDPEGGGGADGADTSEDEEGGAASGDRERRPDGDGNRDRAAADPAARAPARAGSRPAGTWHALGSGMATNVSGVAPMPAAPGAAPTVLIARDNKQPGENRLATVAFGATGEPAVTPVQWDGEEPSDIEGIDAVPGRPGEFVTLTSGGAGHHLSVQGTGARVLGTFAVPGGGGKYEGIALAQLGGGTVAVWADRGQGEAPATISAAPLDLATLAFGTPATTEFTAGDLPADARDVSDIKIGPDGTLLVTSAWEAGDDGPFDGALYDAGRVAATADGVTLTPAAGRTPLLALDGQKVEGLACTGGTCVLGADNENVGGALRLVPDPRAERAVG